MLKVLKRLNGITIFPVQAPSKGLKNAVRSAVVRRSGR
jgi:hypothetical protein